MAANPIPMESGQAMERYHYYHAEADLLTGQIEHPILQPIEDIGRVVLENTRREGLVTQSVGPTSLEGLISFRSGRTRVLGNHAREKTDLLGNDHSGWVTQSSSALEGFNVVDVLTADRVVAQVTTDHPFKDGKVPRVSFIGTSFENLQISGVPVKVELDLTLCSDKPDGDRPYLEHGGFLDRVRERLDCIKKDVLELPKELETRYRAEIAYLEDLKNRGAGRATAERNGYPKLRCTLVKSIAPIPIPGVKVFGNMIFIPDFGTVSLAELEVGIKPPHRDSSGMTRMSAASELSDSHYFKLNMFTMKLGCPTSGTLKGPTTLCNGHGATGG